jgi:hypothetical protein
VAPQLKFRLPEEERDIERVMLHEVCNRDEAIRRLEKHAAAKKSTPVVQAPAHWRDWEDNRED